ncbi:MAG: aminotransferase class V-fold PLP-dependent enzyme [Candidatus Eisenbacteria bacterium]|nr:aminotransferase class V-fold PLP-dependent enzyme [Candidatus Eisenbacteria bacterium]
MADGMRCPRSGSEFARYWSLDPDVLFLNHGSFGACPTPVLAAQARIRARLERQPVQFLVRDLEPLLDEARATLAAFVGADPDDLAFVPNATTGVSTVLRSLRFEPGDELVTTSHEYNACRNALDFVAARTGARVVFADVPFPCDSPDDVVSAVLARVTPRTKLGLFDHVTSLTGMVMPIERLVRELAARGIDTLVDGAHAPGMLPLDVRALGSAYYVGNCHKWLCAPKGAALLCVRRDRQGAVHPLTVSHGANSTRADRPRFRLEFDWTGTDDPTPALCVPVAIRFLGSLLPGGWPELMARNRALALAARTLLCETLDVDPPCPESMIGTLASVPFARGPYRFETTALAFDPMEKALRERYGIEVPVLACPTGPGSIVRISAQIYNSRAQYEVLARALGELLAEGRAGATRA